MSKIICFIKFFIKRLDKNGRRQIVLTAIFAISLNLFAVIIPILQKRLIDSMSVQKLDIRLVLVFLISGLSISVLSVLEVLSLNDLFINLKQKLTFELLESVMRRNNKLLEARGPGAYMVSIFGNSEQIAMLANKNYFSVFAVSLASIITIIISLKWTWIFALIVLISYFLMFTIIWVSNKSYAKNFAIAREYVFELNPKVLEYIENRRDIAAYVNTRLFLSNLKELVFKRDSYFKSAFAANAIGSSAVSSVKNLALTVFFVMSMYQILNKQLSLSTFIALLSYFYLVFIPVKAWYELSAGLKKFEVLHERIKDDIDYKPQVSLPEADIVSLENCSFGYGSDKRLELDLELKGRLGLVGLSGEGKTTVIKLITGRLALDSGEVVYGGINVNNISEAVLGSSTRLYSQNPEIFDANLKFNISLGKTELSQEDYAQTLENLQKNINNSLNWLVNSQAKNLRNYKNKDKLDLLTSLYGINEKQFLDKDTFNKIVDGLKNHDIDKISRNIAPKYCSRLYYTKENYDSIIIELKLEYLKDRALGQRGSGISGGEKTKIALARFLLPVSNEPYLIDEPFVNLDLLSEQENLDILNKFTSNKNGLLISHKMNVVRALCDDIIVLEKGTISERGSHEDLIQNQGLYAQLYEKYLENIDANT